MKIQKSFLLVLFSIFCIPGYSLAGELFITNNINLQTSDTHRVSLRKALRLKAPSSITSLFVFASTTDSAASLRVFWNQDVVHERAVGPYLEMIHFNTSYRLEENDSFVIEFDANISAVTIGVVLRTRGNETRAITIDPDNSFPPEEPNEPVRSITEEELQGFLDDLESVFLDERRLDVVFYYLDYFYQQEFSMSQMALALKVFHTDVFRIEALRILLQLLEKTTEEADLVIDTFRHPYAKRDARYLLRKHRRGDRP